MSSSRTLFVGGIHPETRADELEREFSRYGRLRRCELPRKNGMPGGYAFVEFEDDRDARDAQQGLRDVRICGRILTIQFAKFGPSGSENSRDRFAERPRSPERRDRDRDYDRRDRDRDYDRRDRDRDYDRRDRDRDYDRRDRDRDYDRRDRDREPRRDDDREREPRRDDDRERRAAPRSPPRSDGGAGGSARADDNGSARRDREERGSRSP